MNMKKLTATLTAVLCSASMIGILPGMSQPVRAEQVVYNDFEVNYGGWYGTADSVVLTANEGTGYAQSRGMTVTGRTVSEDGATSSKRFYLSGGVAYDYSAMVYSESDETFRLTLRYADENTGEETVQTLAAVQAHAGKWTKLSASYTAPENSTGFVLTITTDSVNDFAFDEVEITTKEAVTTVHAATAELGLKDEFADYFRVGNILNGNKGYGTFTDTGIKNNIIKDCNSVECENETKPDATLVKNGSTNTDIKVSLASCADIMEFCASNGIGMRGHTLVWHSQTPQWFFKENFDDNGAWVSTTVMDQRMESYIKNMFTAITTQYPDLDLYAYDVCNECVSDDASRTGEPGWGPRVGGYGNGASPWVQVYGDNSFVRKAFTYARKYAPDGCDLYYNDYNEYWDHKRNCIYRMCKSLYEEGLLDGVGMQSHVPANATGFAGTDSYIEAMKLYLSIGCDVQITELDISLLDNGTPKYSYSDQATKYAAIFKAAMDWNKNPQSDGRVTAVCVWGPNDAHSWLASGSNALLYDANNNPKEAYTAVTELVPKSEWGDGTQYSGEVKPVEPNEYGWYFHSTFEGDTDSWEGRGAATVQTSGRTAYKDSEALLVQDRTAAWNGATRALNARAFVPGNEYSFSVNVNYFDGPATDTFYLKLQYTDAAGETQYSTVAEGTGIKGEWVQLANTNYQIPSDATSMQLYVETAETTNNFYIDEAIGAVGGTTILGAGESHVGTKGDLNADGRIDVIDLALVKHGVRSGFAKSTEQLAADVDQSGTVDETDVKLMQQFVVREITEFPVAERAIDFDAMNSLFKSISPAGSYKKSDEANSLYTQRFGADPGFMVYKDRLYVYTTNDAFEYNADGTMRENKYDVGTINCCSTADMVNWTDHGAIPVAGRNGRTTSGVASWASCSWAPDACWKTINGKDKFFLYFANSGGGIGVLTADSPTGPWTDPLGHALVTGATPNCSDVIWMFDPAVLVDDDGTGYLYFGGGVPENNPADPGTGRCVQLGDDMISLAGTPVKMSTPYLFEDSSILKIGDTYYYSYCTNWNTGGNPYGFGNAQIAYMTSKNPLGPFTYQGIMFKNTAEMGLDKGGNNHHSLVEFKGNYYLLYHTRNVELQQNINLNYRSPSVDLATVSNGKVTVNGTMKGVSQIESLDPFSLVQAETMSHQSKDITVTGLGDTVVNGTKGSWFRVTGAACGSNAKSITMKASSQNGAVIKVCTGSESGEAVTFVEIPAGGTMQELTYPVYGLSGNNNLYFVFSGDASVDSWQLN